jgi:hypothetical protein
MRDVTVQWTPEDTVTRAISRSHCILNRVHTGLEYWKIRPILERAV